MGEFKTGEGEPRAGGWMWVKKINCLATGLGISSGSVFYGEGEWAPIQYLNFTGLAILFRGPSLSLQSVRQPLMSGLWSFGS